MMKNQLEVNTQEELNLLCARVRELMAEGDYRECESLITKAMMRFPHAPHPHNLFGLLLERQSDHITAMKHFRAAWSLDPTYLPARQNLDHFGTFFSSGKCAFDESDCQEETSDRSSECAIEYDENGIGHVVRRRK